MNVAEAGIGQPVIELTSEEAWRDFNEKTYAMLAIDAITFLDRLRSGFYQNLDDSDGDILYLALLSESFSDIPHAQTRD